jgi:hypothetical protein
MERNDHLLWIAAEEASETTQRASKAARFGLNETEPGQSLTNAERIEEEFCHLIAAIEMLQAAGVLSKDLFNRRDVIDAKKAKVERYLLYSVQCGTLQEPSTWPSTDMK